MIVRPLRRGSRTTMKNQPLILLVAFIVVGVVVNIALDNQEVVAIDGPNGVRMRTARPSEKNETTSSKIVASTGSKGNNNIADGKTSRTFPDELCFEPSPNVTYPLRALNLESSREAYERGFWQRADPVPLERWEAVANTTCIPHHTQLPGWKQRIPHVVMIGAQKAGTTALSYYLYNHPSIQYFPAKELHYFDEELDQNSQILRNGSGIDATQVLEYFQETIVGGTVPLAKFQYDRLYALDATPNYMWLSDRVPHRLFCAAPWAKLLVLLRDPVERAFSQYMMQLHRDLTNPQSRRGCVSFEDYISLDMKVLQDTGVLPQGFGGWHYHHHDDHDHRQSQPILSLDKSWLTSDKTRKAWANYTKLGLNSPVGRGIYCIQMMQWIQAMDLHNKPRSDLKVISNKQLLDHTNKTYAEILTFLQLPPHSLYEYSKIHQTQYHETEMPSSTRRKLQAFFEPFNRLLDDLHLF